MSKFPGSEFTPEEGRTNIIKPNLPIEEHKRIVAAGLKMMGVKEHEIADIERLRLEAKIKIKDIRAYANTISEGFRMGGIIPDNVQLMRDVNEKFLNSFVHFNKDELLMILVMLLSEAVMKEVA